MANGSGGGQHGASRAFLIYNALRLGLLALCGGIGWLATLRGPVLIVVALAVSGALSWFLLKPQREAMGQAVEQSVERSRVRMSARTVAEDTYVDSMLAAQGSNQPVDSAGEPSVALGDQSSS